MQKVIYIFVTRYTTTVIAFYVQNF